MNRAILTSFLCLCSIAGCGEASDAPATAPVSGVVMLNGQPLPEAVVTFHPESGPSGIGLADANGKYTVKTNGRNGAPVGKCKVTVAVANGPEGFPEADGNEIQLLEKPRLNAKYSNPDTTDLIVEITAEGTKDLQLDLDS
ncbi:MAG: hypothetical protein KDA91_09040 [Planctomycetaceae bacterium]|nr:hypothetical protein [Planctomycetaceae bacterium]